MGERERTEENNGGLLAGRYEVLSTLGQGGMGRVYRVYDRRLGKEWALKALRDERGLLDRRETAGEREEAFLRECSMLKRLNHPFFPRIVDVFREEGRVYLVMDLIEGENLQAILQRGGPLSAEDAVRYAGALADALGVLHKMRPPVLYLDLKPANVMITRDGNVCLVDFGSSFEKGEDGEGGRRVAGTHGYAAPELSDARQEADVRSDIYSLGMTLYAMLTGQEPDRPPYVRHPVRCLNAVIPRRLEQIVERCAAPRKEDRFCSMEELRMALKAEESGNSRRTGWAERLGKAVTFLLLGSAALFFAGMAESGPAGWAAGNNMKEALSGLAFLTGGLLWENLSVERRRRRRKYYRLERSLLLTKKKEGLTLREGLVCFLLFSILAGGALRLYARETYSEGLGQVRAAESKPMQVVLRDSGMRKLLIKDGGVYRTDREMYIEIPADIFEEEEVMELSLSAKNRRTGEKMDYFFLLCRKEKKR